MGRIVVAFSREESRKRIARLLASEGWEAAAVCTSGAEVLRAVHKMGSGVVICGFRLRDMTADALAADLRGLAVVMVLAKADCLELCGGENLFKLPAPAPRSDFFATLETLADLEATRLHRPASQRREEEQRLVRRAKELLMDVNRMSEEEAHRFLQKRSMDSGIRLAEVAQSIIDSYTL
ncbi:MAG: ANTAR domain-containing protein [Oscillibacter sp.]|nr:ANTAR domain-containing protein [Oscillibacter sp.]